ncbi:unnamed protein product [Anisakis simplex]|uniref:ATP synthase subunit f, mitochondrial n=1 Tax=Anisakis simplex TaxID=6269 RepID=A0A0M3KE03_ANISI|nr:unnamed protein product [Anisakis simplex]
MDEGGQSSDANVRPKFVPNTKRTFWSSRFWYNLVYYKRKFRYRTSTTVVSAIALYIIGYNVLVRQWKGADHPVNRFNWRLKEKRGELDEDLLRKKDVDSSSQSLAYAERLWLMRYTGPRAQISCSRPVLVYVPLKKPFDEWVR